MRPCSEYGSVQQAADSGAHSGRLALPAELGYGLAIVLNSPSPLPMVLTDYYLPRRLQVQEEWGSCMALGLVHCFLRPK